MPEVSTLLSTWRHPKHLFALGILLFLPSSVFAQSERIRSELGDKPPDAAAVRRDDVEEMLLEVDLNRQGLHETVLFLKDKRGTFLVGEDDLQRWRLRKPDSAAYRHEGKDYYPLAAIPGATYQLDEVRQTLTIETSAEAFATTVAPVAAPRPYPPPLSPPPATTH